MVAHGRRGREPAGVVRYDAGSGGPQQLSVSGGAIRAGGHTLVMVDPSDNGLWRYTGRDARWQRIVGIRYPRPTVSITGTGAALPGSCRRRAEMAFCT